MSLRCQVTGKRAQAGNRVSHAQNKTRHRFLPNIHKKKFWLESERRWVKLSLSAHGLRILDKRGIEAVVRDIRARGERV